ncbi:MAG: SDR family NAD(P)-dependent oxidoreductase, partial [Polyangiaceae bacterium]
MPELTVTMRAIVTGGAGFIGSNAVKRFMAAGWDVAVIDDLSRKGADKNLDWLRTQGTFAFHKCDIRDFAALSAVFRQHGGADAVIHLAAQVAVTTSVADPRHDFEVNAGGTFNVLEAARAHTPGAAFLYSSTNKVYGGLDHIGVEEEGGRWQYRGKPNGVSEAEPLDFHSPYGCSKGAADQYVRDYARIYGMRTVCLRQSCIYGRRQFGVEDQGWVAWFT